MLLAVSRRNRRHLQGHILGTQCRERGRQRRVGSGVIFRCREGSHPLAVADGEPSSIPSACGDGRKVIRILLLGGCRIPHVGEWDT